MHYIGSFLHFLSQVEHNASLFQYVYVPKNGAKVLKNWQTAASEGRKVAGGGEICCEMGISVDILSAEDMLAWGLYNVDGWQACAAETTCLTCWSDDPRNGAEMGFWTEATSVDYESYFRQARKLVA